MGRRGSTKDRSAMVVAAVVIVLITIIGLTNGQREQMTWIERWIGNLLSPVQTVVSTGVNTVGEGIRSIFSIGRIKEENERLSEQVNSLQQEVIAATLDRAELEELRSLRYALNVFEPETAGNLITAQVIGKTTDNWFNLFTINVGRTHGVELDSVVLAANGLIGRVYEVGDNWAKVISIIDNNSSVSFQVLRDAASQGIVSGSVSFELSGYLFDPQGEVVVGDKLITSGLGIYPKGILIGQVVEVGKTNDQLLTTVKVEPAVNFNHMNKVLVMQRTRLLNIE